MNYSSQIFEKSVLQMRELDSQLELITSVEFYHYSDTEVQSNAFVNEYSFEMVLISDEHSISNHETGDATKWKLK